MRILPNIKSFIIKNKFVSKYFRSRKFRINISIVFNVIYNTVYVAINTVFGAVYKSPWFFTVAIYHCLLLFVSYIILKAEERISSFPQKVRRSCIMSGALLIVADIPMTVMMIYTARAGGAGFKNSLLISELVFYCVFNVIRVIYSIIQSKRNSAPVRRVIYTVRSVSALMSLFNLFVALIPIAGSGVILRTLLALFVSATVFILSALLIHYLRSENNFA